MTGWRIGYMAGPREFIAAFDSFQSQTTSNPCSISQSAAIAALGNGKDSIEFMRKEFEKRRNLIVEEIRKLPYISCKTPQGAFYVLLNIKNVYGKNINGKVIKNSTDCCEELLNFGIAVVPGAAFGADDCIRLSYATSDENIVNGIKRIENFLKALSD
jgi:aspartate aminotransferase